MFFLQIFFADNWFKQLRYECTEFLKEYEKKKDAESNAHLNLPCDLYI